VTVLCYENALKNTLIDYYTLCPASIQRDALSEKIFKGPRPNPISGFRLCRLAIDKNFKEKDWENYCSYMLLKNVSINPIKLEEVL
jgi:hypothetical protein